MEGGTGPDEAERKPALGPFFQPREGDAWVLRLAEGHLSDDRHHEPTRERDGEAGRAEAKEAH